MLHQKLKSFQEFTNFRSKLINFVKKYYVRNLADATLVADKALEKGYFPNSNEPREEGYLFGIAKNLALSHHRTKPKHQLLGEWLPEIADIPKFDELVGIEPKYLGDDPMDERYRILEKCLKTEEEQQVIDIALTLGTPCIAIDAIAKEMQLEKRTVKNITERIKDRVRKWQKRKY
ncbi:MAG: RNA polymerase sigma factor [Flammeovirgaceae bacterium]